MKRRVALLARHRGSRSPRAGPAAAAERHGRADATTRQPVWAPAQAGDQPGDTVTWTFAGTTLPHNVESRRAPTGT